MKINKPIYLRAHHILCLQGYQGYGYDETFKKNMNKLFYQLNINNKYNDKIYKENDNYNNKYNENIKNIIILTDYPDDLCSNCPNLIDEKCTGETIDMKSAQNNNKKINLNNEKIIKMDQLVLQKAKLNKNNEYIIDEVISSVNKVFDNKEKATEVCGDCKWEDKCLWFQTRKLEK